MSGAVSSRPSRRTDLLQTASAVSSTGTPTASSGTPSAAMAVVLDAVPRARHARSAPRDESMAGRSQKRATREARASASPGGARGGERLLDVHEAAALLGLKASTLYQWAYKRRIPVVKLFGPRGALRFRLSDVERLIQDSLRPAVGRET